MTNAMLAFVCLVALKAFMFGYLIGWSQCRRFKDGGVEPRRHP